jgi:hypothetical protein
MSTSICREPVTEQLMHHVNCRRESTAIMQQQAARAGIRCIGTIPKSAIPSQQQMQAGKRPENLQRWRFGDPFHKLLSSRVIYLLRKKESLPSSIFLLQLRQLIQFSLGAWHK